MAWVRLQDSARGIPLSTKGKVFITSFGKSILKAKSIKELKPFVGKQISIQEFIDKLPSFAGPEWMLDSKGRLISWALWWMPKALKGKRCQCKTFYGIDITKYLSSLTDKEALAKARSIAGQSSINSIKTFLKRIKKEHLIPAFMEKVKKMKK